MQRFKSPEQAQRFLEPIGVIGDHFRPRRHLLPADRYRAVMAERFRSWREVTEEGPAP
jgi:putative transposase